LGRLNGTLKYSIGFKSPYRYKVYRYDTETGLYYIQSRYYNPEWGRFINADGITGVNGELLSHNIFAYCYNNPVNMHDPSGYFAWFIPVAYVVMDIIAAVSVFFLTQAPAISQASMAVTPHVDKIAAVQDKISNGKNNSSNNSNNNKDPGKSGYKNYNAKQIEKKYGMKKGEFHQLKQDILSEAKKNFPKEMKGLEIIQIYI